MTPWLTETTGFDGPLGILADATPKATLLLLLSWLVGLMLRRRSAAVRHRLWALALSGSIALPLVSWLVPGWRLPLFPVPARTATVTLPAALPASNGHALEAPADSRSDRAALFGAGTSQSRAISDRRASARPAPRSRRAEAVEATSLPLRSSPVTWSIPGGMLVVWGVGAFATGLPTLLGLVGNRRLRRRSRRVIGEDWVILFESLRGMFAIRRNVALLQGGASPIPLTWGVVRPVILLPEDAPCWPEGKRRLVLLHELAHIRRCDAAFQLAGRLAAVLYWFHPLVWYALHRLRIECEHACDDCVVLAGERPTDYASQLLELARSARATRFSMSIAVARTNVLEERLVSLFDDTRSRQPVDRGAGRLLAAGAAVLVLGLAMVHPGFSAAPREGQSAAAGKAAPNAVEPPANATGRIAGRVVRGDGRDAVGAAEVVLLLPPPKGENVYIGKLPLRRSTSDAKGSFSFDGLAPGRYRVWANLGKLTSRPRRARGQVVILPESGEAPRPVELRLVRGVSVSVRVKEKATGKPIGSATVQPGWSDFLDDFTTDLDGQVRAQPFTRERWLLEVWADGFAKQSRWLNLENGSDAEAEFLLDPGGDLEGVVRDPSGKPVSGVGLSIFLEGTHDQFAYVETGADGRYRLRHLPVNIALRILDLRKGDYVHEAIPTHLTGPRQELNLTLRLRPHGGSIAGFVLDSNGRPIAGAELINPSNSSSDFRRSETGPDGRFRLENLYESITGKEVVVRAKGFAPKHVRVEPGPAAKPAEVKITLDPGHHIKGRVTDLEDRPLEGVRVDFAGGQSPGSDGGTSTTDALGRFEFDSLPANAPFIFRKEGYSAIADRNLPLDGGDLITIEMVPAGMILGKVSDARTGKPIRTFNVQITFSPQRQPGDPSSGLRSDLVNPGQVYQSPDGRFKIGELVSGMPLQVMIAAEGYERGLTERVVAAPAGEAKVEEFRLDPLDRSKLRTYRGRLLDSRGKPVVGARLRLFAARDRDPNRRADFPFNWTMIRSGQLAQQSKVVRFLESTTDSRGRFEFTGIPKGTEVELAWWGKGIAPGRADHLERPGDDQEEWLDITIPAPARIAGSVDRKTYTSARRIQVSSSGAAFDYADIELKPDQTEFEFDDLPPGEYTVSLMTAFERASDHPGGLTTRTLATVKVTVSAGETGKVDF